MQINVRSLLKNLLIGIALIAAFAGTAVLVVTAMWPRASADADADAPPDYIATQIAYDPVSAPSILPPVNDIDLLSQLLTPAWPIPVSNTVPPAVATQPFTAQDLDALRPKDLSSTCLNSGDEVWKSCTFNAGGLDKIAVVGDSVAMSWGPMIRSAYPDAQVTMYGKEDCPYAEVNLSESCAIYHERIWERFALNRPNTVFLAASDSAMGIVDGSANDGPLGAAWSVAVQAQVSSLSQMADTVIVLSAPVAGQDLATCATLVNLPSDCISTISPQRQAMTAATAAGVSAVNFPVIGRAIYIDTASWFCASDGQCPALFAGVPIRADAENLTDYYSNRLAPNLAGTLLPLILVLPPVVLPVPVSTPTPTPVAP